MRSVRRGIHGKFFEPFSRLTRPPRFLQGRRASLFGQLATVAVEFIKIMKINGLCDLSFVRSPTTMNLGIPAGQTVQTPRVQDRRNRLTWRRHDQGGGRRARQGQRNQSGRCLIAAIGIGRFVTITRARISASLWHSRFPGRAPGTSRSSGRRARFRHSSCRLRPDCHRRFPNSGRSRRSA